MSKKSIPVKVGKKCNNTFSVLNQMVMMEQKCKDIGKIPKDSIFYAKTPSPTPSPVVKKKKTPVRPSRKSTPKASPGIIRKKRGPKGF